MKGYFIPLMLGVLISLIALSFTSPKAAPLEPPPKPSVLVATQYSDVFMDKETGCQYVWVYGGLVKRDGTGCKIPD